MVESIVLGIVVSGTSVNLFPSKVNRWSLSFLFIIFDRTPISTLEFLRQNTSARNLSFHKPGLKMNRNAQTFLATYRQCKKDANYIATRLAETDQPIVDEPVEEKLISNATE